MATEQIPTLLTPNSFDSLSTDDSQSDKSSNEFPLPLPFSDEQNPLLTALEERTIWLREYHEDIFQTLLASEQKRAHIVYGSSYAKGRQSLLRLMKFIAIHLSLARTTFHLSVYLLDHFMETTRPEDEQMRLLGVSCLLLAAKAEDPCIPVFTDFNSYVNFSFKTADYRMVEKRIILRFNFEFCRPSVATFGELFSPNILTLEEFTFYNIIVSVQKLDDKSVGRRTTANRREHLEVRYECYDDMRKHLIKFMLRLCDLCLIEMEFANVRPSVLAGACIAATRRMQGVLMDWSAYLTYATHFNSDDVTPFVERILQLYEEDERFCYAVDYVRLLKNFPAEVNPFAGLTPCVDVDTPVAQSQSSSGDPFPTLPPSSPSAFEGISVMTGKPVACVVYDHSNGGSSQLYQLCTIAPQTLPVSHTGQQLVEAQVAGQVCHQFYNTYSYPGGLEISQWSDMSVPAFQTCPSTTATFNECQVALSNAHGLWHEPSAESADMYATVVTTDNDNSNRRSTYESTMDSSHDSGIMTGIYSSGEFSFNCSIANQSGIYRQYSYTQEQHLGPPSSN